MTRVLRMKPADAAALARQSRRARRHQDAPGAETADALRARLLAAEEENARLRARVRELEREVATWEKIMEESTL